MLDLFHSRPGAMGDPPTPVGGVNPLAKVVVVGSKRIGKMCDRLCQCCCLTALKCHLLAPTLAYPDCSRVERSHVRVALPND